MKKRKNMRNNIPGSFLVNKKSDQRSSFSTCGNSSSYVTFENNYNDIETTFEVNYLSFEVNGFNIGVSEKENLVGYVIKQRF